MGQGVLSLRMSALYAGLAAAALITAFVVAATTSFGAGAATIVLVSAALGFVVGRTPMGEGAEGAAFGEAAAPGTAFGEAGATGATGSAWAAGFFAIGTSLPPERFFNTVPDSNSV